MTKYTIVHVIAEASQCPALLEAITDMDFFPRHISVSDTHQVYAIEDFSEENCVYLALMVPGVRFDYPEPK